MNFKNLNVEEFKETIEKTEDAFVLDVRTEAELVDGSVEGYTLIDINQADFQDKIDELDKSKTYFVYCRAGGRSARACTIMGEMGFEKLYNLAGGITAWNEYHNK